MIKTAVILAAGLGSRLSSETKNKPKGFMEIDGLSLIERSVQKLIKQGIEKIVIGTGYLANFYEDLAQKYSQIICVRNDEFKNTGSMGTLACLVDYLDEEFLLLESDLLYEQRAIFELINDDNSNIVLSSDWTGSGDEVYVWVDEDVNLLNMSKQSNYLPNPYSELVGISKLSKELLLAMVDYYVISDNPMLDYEMTMVKVREIHKIYIKRLVGLAWCEIDDLAHYERATQKVSPLISQREFRNVEVKRNVLLNPGPATTTNSVKFAQIVPDICPREKEFGTLMDYISQELTRFVANTQDYTSVLFAGSGTAAVESMLASVAIGKLLIVNNGAYGRRMCEIADAYELDYLEYQSSNIEPINLDDFENFIQGKGFKYLAVVHSETTTGLLNDLKSIGNICKRMKVEMLVDVMSSYGAVPINMVAMNVSYLAASSNKNLQGMAGVSFVVANKSKLEELKNQKSKLFYLDLYKQYKGFQKTWQMRFTPPVQTLYALKQAIIELKNEGVENRYKRYSANWEVLMKGLKALGLETLVDKSCHSRIITTVCEPDKENYSFEGLHEFMKRRGYVLYPGKVTDRNTFRISNIGDLQEQDIEAMLIVLKEYLHRLN
ncbi:MAG: 2-aminoethylphosphonate--pyruvate transaminase [Candidatus Margulisbacteria bacterium]|nr:2-aminoethylphosphonate--pyruvate transaminase [Candidatus Margulisiibacteriota bacterium]